MADGGVGKAAKWLMKNGVCNGSAVVSPFPVDQIDRASNAPSGHRRRHRAPDRGVDKVLGLLGPETPDQQRQIHTLLAQSRMRRISNDEITSDSDSDSDLTSSEAEARPHHRSTTSRHTKTPSPLKPGIKTGVSSRSKQTAAATALDLPSPRPKVQKGDDQPAISGGTGDSSFQFPTSACASPLQRPKSLSYNLPPAGSFPLPRIFEFCQQQSVNRFPPSPLRYVESPQTVHKSQWCQPHCCSPRQAPEDVAYQEAPRRSFTQSSNIFAYSEPQSPYLNSPFQCFGSAPVTEVVLSERLGCGSYGVVYRGELQIGQSVAVKVFHNERDEISAKEVFVLSRLDHQHIVKYLGTTTLRDGRFAILLELMKRSLSSLVKDSSGLGEPMTRVYTRQILHGLEYLHRMKIVHRDVKCANILLDSKGTAKLADFGLAKKIDYSIAKSCKGTFFYMAPEVLLTSGQEQYGVAADIWSLGCTVIEMVSGKPPWNGFAIMPFYESLREGRSPPIPEQLSPEAVDFVKLCLIGQSHRRPTASMLLQHPFVKP